MCRSEDVLESYTFNLVANLKYSHTYMSPCSSSDTNVATDEPVLAQGVSTEPT